MSKTETTTMGLLPVIIFFVLISLLPSCATKPTYIKHEFEDQDLKVLLKEFSTKKKT